MKARRPRCLDPGSESLHQICAVHSIAVATQTSYGMYLSARLHIKAARTAENHRARTVHAARL